MLEPHLAHRVGLVAVVEVGLHAGGLLHHPLAEPSLARHVGIHDPVTLFGYQLDLVDRADGLHPESQHHRAVFVADLDELFDMAAELGVRAVNRLALLARKLDLAARLDRDRGALALKSDNASVLLVRLVAVALGHPAQNLLDAARP